jgi:hypothetical protein
MLRPDVYIIFYAHGPIAHLIISAYSRPSHPLSGLLMFAPDHGDNPYGSTLLAG